MNNYKFDSIVTRKEADALKEMIFQRARERAGAMNEDVHSDVMDLARDSFTSKDNPFAKIIEQTKPEPSAKADSEIGFAQKERPAAFQVKSQNKAIGEQQVQAAVQNNMIEARNALSNKQSFMGALNFLNSQAAISLIRTRADKFEIVA